MKLRALPIYAIFLVMGVADAMGPLAEAVRQHYQLSNAMASLLTFFVFIAFALFSVPGGALAARTGKKNLLMLGLGINAAAVLVPAVALPSYGVLLACIFLLGVGTTLLQVAGNPIVRDVSAPGRYARNLSFAQFMKGIGSAGSSYLTGMVVLVPVLSGMGWRGVFPLFLGLMLLALALLVPVKVEEARVDSAPGILASLSLLATPTFAYAVLGIFLYVGAEVCLARYLQPALSGLGLAPARAALLGPTLFFGSLTVGRLVGSAILNFLAPRTFYRLSVACGILGLLALLAGGLQATVLGAVLCGLGFANLWPLIFSITVEARPGVASELSGLMCMAIAGGAVLPLIMGRVLDLGHVRLGFLVPLAALVYLLVHALASGPVTQEA